MIPRVPPPRPRRWLARAIILAALAALIAYWAARHGKSFVVLLVKVHGGWAGFPLGAMYVLFALNGFAFHALCRAAGAAMRPLEWLGIHFVSNMASYLLPFRAGAAVKVAYLNRRHAVGITRGSMVVLADNLVFIGAGGLCGLALLGLGAAFPGTISPGLWGILAVAASLALVPLAPIPAPASGFGLTGRVLRTARETWMVLRRSRKAMALAFLVRAVSHLLGGAILWCSFRAFGGKLSLPDALAMNLLLALSGLIALTPSNLGIQEAVTGYLSCLAGGSMAEGVLAGALLRFAHLLATLSLGPLFLPFLVPGGRLFASDAPLPEPETLLPETFPDSTAPPDPTDPSARLP